MLSVPDRTLPFNARALGNSPPLEQVTLRCSRARPILTVADLKKLDPGDYGIGRGGFPAVDGVLKHSDGSVDLLQMTVSPVHGMNHNALKSIVEALGDTVRRILWIVPSTRFATFPAQTFRVSGSEKVYTRPSPTLLAIPQYVVDFPNDDGLLVGAAGVQDWLRQDELKPEV